MTVVEASQFRLTVKAPGSQNRLVVPLLQRNEETLCAMILGCGDSQISTLR